MRGRCLFPCAALLIAAQVLLAAAPRVAISDFVVSSERPKMSVIGKGLAEMIAAEMVSAGDIVLIDRDRRIKLLGEQEFALSIADYILSGEIMDMDSRVLFAASMVRVATGQVVWSDKYLGALADYDLISTQFARSALNDLGAAKGAAVAAEPLEATAEKKEEALFAFSMAVDSYDQLEVARRIDPRNPAVRLYLRKTAALSRRLQGVREERVRSESPELELDEYAPSYNPARLGLIENGSLYCWVSSNPPRQMIDPVVEHAEPVADMIRLLELSATQRLGVLLPLGKRFGLATEVSWRIVEAAAETLAVGPPPGPDVAINFPGLSYLSLYSHALGAHVGVGYKVVADHVGTIAEGLCLGMGARVAVIGPWRWLWYGEEVPDNAYTLLGAAGASYALDAGLTAQLGIVGAEAQVIWSNQPDPYIDDVADPLSRTLNAGTVPLILILSTTGDFLDRRLLLGLKEIVDVYTDERSAFAFRLIPALEWWPLDRLALRAGYEYSWLEVGEVSNDGHGFMVGLTGLLGRWEIHFDFVHRYRPSRIILGEFVGHPDYLMFGLTWNGLNRRG
jgi:TolB-like protein